MSHTFAVGAERICVRKEKRMIELKPCPFCGGEAKLDHWNGTANVYSFVRCQNTKECGIEGKRFIESPSYASDERAIKAWNRREGEQP